MLAKYDWIAVDMRFFGQPNTAYDFKANDPKEAQKKIQKLEATKVTWGSNFMEWLGSTHCVGTS